MCYSFILSAGSEEWIWVWIWECAGGRRGGGSVDRDGGE